MEHSYINLYKDYLKALKQRNSLLKKNDLINISYWTDLVSDLGTKINSTRKAYFDDFNNAFQNIKEEMQTLLPNIYADIKDCKVSYYQGWDNNISLKESLSNTLEKDTIIKYTSKGPHRADMIFSVGNSELKNTSSMSTQIISSLLVIISQAKVFHVKHKYNPIILIDDLFFGIDDKNLQACDKLINEFKSTMFFNSPRSI